MPESIELRKQKLLEKKEKITEELRALTYAQKQRERRERARRLIELGGLVEVVMGMEASQQKEFIVGAIAEACQRVQQNGNVQQHLVNLGRGILARRAAEKAAKKNE
ncbi:conjugal transfer protein TraD [Sporolituus thermophilus]|uniref:Conjugal transfer protein TraD n=1 Tax=Sporolituus thermophilus DSM 23256 TaxID=1123285 RepID=A0A1G7MHB3_9FIRM|nr:conjugal transfer protein TraD [Sporolituus thermophilus]SDF61258.1 Conjugal transfer protein TraD [Sporolituus thermophilus DSM 23256]